jgi:hypothetical protein
MLTRLPRPRLPAGVGLFLMAVLLAGAPAEAEGVAYRLRIASLYEDAFGAFVGPGELEDGATGPGLERLFASLTSGDVPGGALLGDRPPAFAWEALARAFGAVPVRGEFVTEPGSAWYEARWEGTPGERSVWVMAPTATNTQELDRVVLQGAAGPPRQYRAYPVPLFCAGKMAAVKYPLGLLQAQQSLGTLWTRYLSSVLDLSLGIALVVGDNDMPTYADHAYVLVEQAPTPTTYSAVLVWERRGRAGKFKEVPPFDSP